MRTTGDTLDPPPGDWPVLVTGAGGFVGGHIARALAAAGHRVRGLVRRPPRVARGDPDIDWHVGDLLDPATIRPALRGVRGVIHAAGWVSLGPDSLGEAARLNIDATRALLAVSRSAGVERFVYTSTLHTLAAGTRDEPADEATSWNLQCVDSPYSRTKREAERLVREAAGGRFETLALCPGMVVGDRAERPTSTRLLLHLARSPVAIVPGGGIPIVDAHVLSQAHRRALIAGDSGDRFAVVGPYLSYPEQAALVAAITGRPRRVFVLPDRAEGSLRLVAGWISRWTARWPDVAPATVAGGFLRLHVCGERADRTFGLRHPEAIETFRLALRPPDPVGR